MSCRRRSRSPALYTVRMSDIAILERMEVVRRGRRLEYFTIGWNIIEGLVAVAAGAIAGSISLVGFGIDSFIEVTSELFCCGGCRLTARSNAASGMKK